MCRFVAAIIFIASATLVCQDANAFGMGGGGRGSVVSGRRGQTSAGRNGVISGRKGVTSEGRNLVKRPIGGKSSGGGHGGNRGNRAAGNNFTRWTLPAAAAVDELNTKTYDDVKDALKLSDKQTKNIDEVIQSIKDRRTRALQNQTDARTIYNGTNDKASAIAAGKNVMLTLKACKALSPNIEFRQKLMRLLDSKQKGQVRVALLEK